MKFPSLQTIGQNPYLSRASHAIGNALGAVAQSALAKVASPEYREIAQSLTRDVLPTSLQRARAWGEVIQFYAFDKAYVDMNRSFSYIDALTAGARILANPRIARTIANQILFETTKVDEAVASMRSIGVIDIHRLGRARNPSLESGPKVIRRPIPSQSEYLSNVVFQVIDSKIAPPGMVYAEWQIIAGSQRLTGYFPASQIEFIPE